MSGFYAAAKRFFFPAAGSYPKSLRFFGQQLIPAFLLLFLLPAAVKAETYPLAVPPKQNWSFSGIFGTYDKAQLQRGLKVFTETCRSCHSLNYVPFRDFQALGYSMAEIKEFASQFHYSSMNRHGEEVERLGTPQDYFRGHHANEAEAAFAHNGIVPPDLSLIVQARAVRRPFSFITDLFTYYDTAGEDYIYALLTGYRQPPQNIIMAEGQFYNPYFISAASLSMQPPLTDGLIAYNYGTAQTISQYAGDVTAFLSWTADPHREVRKKTGFSVIIFLLVLGGLLYCLKREIWAKPPGKN